MNRILAAATTLALLALGRIDAQDMFIRSQPLFSLYNGPDDPWPGIGMNWFDKGEIKPLGETDAKGQLRLPGTLAAPGESIGVFQMRCLNKKYGTSRFNVGIALTREDTARDELERLTGCSAKALDPMRFGQDYTAFLDPESAATNKPKAPFFKSPAGYATLGGAGAATIFIALPEGDDDPGPDTGAAFPSFPIVATSTATIAQLGGCFLNSYQAQITFSGSEQALRAVEVESATRIFNGTATFSPDKVDFRLTGTGTIPGIGNFSGQLNGSIFRSGSIVTAIEILGLPCGTVTLNHSGSFREAGF